MPEIDHEFIQLQDALSGEYSIERELGRGGMGIVYLAREVQLDRLVAIKVLPRALANDPRVRERFLREARLAASLSHPHIVPIFRVGEAAGAPYFVMAYVPGETLGERLRRRGPISPTAATQLFREVAWALAYAHGHGIVHRDVKPDNILLEEGTGRALVTDFGIARTEQRLEGEEPEGFAGTAQFMSPEQISGAGLDGRSDLYSLGVTAYLAVTGRMPFTGETPGQLIRSRLHDAPRPASEALPSVPRFLGDAIDRCLRSDPAERFENGEALAVAFQAPVPARAELPEQLRAWVSARDPLTSVYLTLIGGGGVTALVRLIVDLKLGRVMDSEAAMLLGLALASLVPAAAYQVRSMSTALRSGFSLADLRRALDVRSGEIAAERRSQPADTAYQRHGRVAARTIVVGAAGFVLADISGFLIHTGYDWTGIVFLVALATVPLSAAFGFPILRRGLGDQLFALRSRFWKSRLGGWVANKLAPPPGSVAPQFVHRPTEIALGAAIADLFGSLPTAYRASLGDVDAVVHRLEEAASDARAQIDVIDSQVAAASGSPHHVQDTAHQQREAARRELARAVGALESIRLGLLRLHGGSSDLRPITTVLDAARSIDADLRRLRDAEKEVGLESAWSNVEAEPLTPV